MQEIAGRDSPGVGSYKYDYAKLSKSILAKPNITDPAPRDYSFTRAPKFFEISSNFQLR